MGTRAEELLFILFEVLLVAGCYLAFGLTGLVILPLAYLLPLYVLRAIVWSCWPWLRPRLSSALTPTGFLILGSSAWGGLGVVTWLYAPAAFAQLGRMPLPAWAVVPGGVLVGSGWLLACWALLLIGARTAMLLTRIFDEQTTEGREVVKTGPYAVVPHPAFLGEWLIISGCFLLTGELAMLALLVIAVLADTFAARGEEKDLVERFGDEYEKYRSKPTQ